MALNSVNINYTYTCIIENQLKIEINTCQLSMAMGSSVQLQYSTCIQTSPSFYLKYQMVFHGYCHCMGGLTGVTSRTGDTITCEVVSSISSLGR